MGVITIVRPSNSKGIEGTRSNGAAHQTVLNMSRDLAHLNKTVREAAREKFKRVILCPNKGEEELSNEARKTVMCPDITYNARIKEELGSIWIEVKIQEELRKPHARTRTPKAHMTMLRSA